MALFFGIFLSCTGNNASDTGSEEIWEPGRIYGQVSELPGRKILLFELYGDRVTLIDSVMAATDGSFEFHFPGTREKGMYRVTMGKPTRPGDYEMHLQQFDLIWDGTTVVFETHYAAPVDSMRIILSEENRHYYQLLRQMDDYYRKMTILSTALVHYPSDDNFYRRLERQYRRVQNRRSNYIDNLAKKNKGAIFSSIAWFYKMPRIVSPADDGGISELRDDFFFPGQFADPVLLRTDLIPGKITRYLSLHQDPGIGDEEQLERIIDAVDVIMQHAMENEEVFYFVLEYLINGFVKMEGMDQVSGHLTNRYLHGNICFREGRLLDQDGDWQPERGVVAPGFRFTALDGRQVDLYETDAKYTIILFWGSWCPHCGDIMEGLFELYTRYSMESPGFLEVIAIGIEDDEQQWLEYIESRGYDWINYSSFDRWDCQIARKYNPEGTPTIILLDSEKRVQQETLRIRALERFLSGRL
jgi:thiol-disulfide isomerase/thioredoxin